MVFQTQIPRDDLFVRASARGLPVGVLKEGSQAVAVFDALRAEVAAKLAPHQLSIAKSGPHPAAGDDQRMI
jgi:hypothetical protein